MNARVLPLLALLASAGALAGCPTTPPTDASVPPADAYASATVCPDGSTVTYESFGQNFLESFCLRCHSEENVGSLARNGAPEDVNFDSVELVRPLARRMDFMAVIGPGREARLMPPSDPRPTDDQRRMLGEWLACGAP